MKIPSIDLINDKLTEDCDYQFITIKDNKRSIAILNYEGYSSKVKIYFICANSESIMRNIPTIIQESGSEIIYIAICANQNKYKDITIHKYKDGFYEESLRLVDFVETIQGMKVSIDTTAFNEQHLFRILEQLKSNSNEISLVYAEPENYKYGDLLFYDYKKYLSAFTGDELTGRLKNDSTEDIYIFMLGFDRGMTEFVVKELDPQNIFIINGFPGYLPKNKDISILNNIDIVGNNSKVYYAQANNPFKVYNAINNIVVGEKITSENLITIIPLGTRPMFVGAAMYAIMNSNVRIYSVSSSKCNNESVGVNKVWRYKLDF